MHVNIKKKKQPKRIKVAILSKWDPIFNSDEIENIDLDDYDFDSILLQ